MGRDPVSLQVYQHEKTNRCKGDLKRCSVNSLTNTIICLIYDLILWIIHCEYIKFLFPSRCNGHRGQMSRGFGSDDLYRSLWPSTILSFCDCINICCHWIAREVFEVKFCLFVWVFCIFKNSCVWTLLAWT